MVLPSPKDNDVSMKALMLLACFLAVSCSSMSKTDIRNQEIAGTFLAYFVPKLVDRFPIVYLRAEGLDERILVDQVRVNKRGFMIKTGNGWRVINGKLIDSETGQPCIALQLAVRPESGEIAKIELTWTGSRGDWSISTYTLSKRDGAWIVVDHTVDAIK